MSSSQPVVDPGPEPDATARGPVNPAGARSAPPSPDAPEPSPDHRYLLDNARVEAGERFTWLAELFDGVTRGHFDRLGLTAGWRCWDVGAGGPSIPEALATTAGLAGPGRRVRGAPARHRRGPWSMSRRPAASRSAG